MNGYLLDTHVLLWYASDDNQLNANVRQVLLSSTLPVYISDVSWWEIAIKNSIGKLPLRTSLASLIADMRARGFEALTITAQHLIRVNELAFPSSGHRDPFDRLLIAQAQTEGLVLLTQDGKFKDYEVRSQS